jgi:hypothetical protein
MTLRPRLATGLPFHYISYYIYPILKGKAKIEQLVTAV